MSTSPLISKMSCSSFEEMFMTSSLNNLIEFTKTNSERLFWFVWGDPGLGKTEWAKCYHAYLNKDSQLVKGTYVHCQSKGTCVRAIADIREYIEMIIKDAQTRKGKAVSVYVFDEAHDFSMPKNVWSEFKSLYDNLHKMNNPNVRILFISNQDQRIIADPAMAQRIGKIFQLETLTKSEAIGFAKYAALKGNIAIPADDKEIFDLLIAGLQNGYTPRSIILSLEYFSKGFSYTDQVGVSDEHTALNELMDWIIFTADDIFSKKIKSFYDRIQGFNKILLKLYLKMGFYDENIISALETKLQSSIVYNPLVTAFDVKRHKMETFILECLHKLSRNKGSICTLVNVLNATYYDNINRINQYDLHVQR